MRKKFVFILTIFCLLLSGCALQITDVSKEGFIDVNKLHTQAIDSLKEHTPMEIQENINSLAPAVAKALAKDKSFKDLLGFEVGKKFDGDYDTLYDTISLKTTKSGKTVHQILKENGKLVDEKVKTIPYFNISIPAGFDKWGTYDGPIYVIPMRYDIDDTKITALPGYDGNGNVRMFPADKVPDYPVVVIGINERVDILSKKQAQVAANLNPKNVNNTIKCANKSPLEATTQELDDGSLNREEMLRGIRLNQDYDTWYNSANEIYCLYAVGENEWALRQDYPNVNLKDQQYLFDSVIFHYANKPNNMYWKLVIREADWDWGKYITFKVTGGFEWKTQKYSIVGDFGIEKQITDGDDNVGETQIYFYHPLLPYGYSEILCGGAFIRLGYAEYNIQ